jgi:hypothetical protein
LNVISEEEKDKFEIQFDAGYGDVRVTGSSIGTVMDKVYRRLDFHDREAARIDISMKQLTDDRHNLDGI